MQTAAQAPARPPTPVVTVPAAQGFQTITIPMPRTAADIDALNARREELSSQLKSVDTRRSKLISQLKQTGDATATQGLEARLALLDARQLQLETDIQQTGQQLTSPAAGVIASTAAVPVFGGLASNQVMTLSVLSILFVFFPLAVGIARSAWKSCLLYKSDA